MYAEFLNFSLVQFENVLGSCRSGAEYKMPNLYFSGESNDVILVLDMLSRGQAAGYLKTKALSKVTQKTFINDSIKAWNRAPNDLKNTVTIHGAKAAIKKFVKTIPI